MLLAKKALIVFFHTEFIMTPYTIETELHDNEKLLWKGRPNLITKYTWYKSNIVLSLIPLLLLAVQQIAFNRSEPNNISLVLSLLAIGCFIIGIITSAVSGSRTDKKLRNTTEYAVTNKRIIVSYDDGSRKVKSMDFKSIAEVKPIIELDGRGILVFEKYNYRVNRWIIKNYGIAHSLANNIYAFYMIPDAQKVNEIIRELQSEGLS